MKSWRHPRLGREMVYEKLNPTFRSHINRLVRQTRTLLWPERHDALDSFRKGISRSEPADLKTSVKVLGIDVPDCEDEEEKLFRLLLTAYLERLDDKEVTNPDQAAIYACSLNEQHVALATAWFENHPDYRAPFDPESSTRH